MGGDPENYHLVPPSLLSLNACKLHATANNYATGGVISTKQKLDYFDFKCYLIIKLPKIVCEHEIS